MEEERRNWDKIGANMNNIRTKTLIKDADIVVVRYRQWNAAFDAGYAAALGKSIITRESPRLRVFHPPEISHMLKEVNASASADANQVVDTLAYVINGDLPEPRDGGDWLPIADRLGAGNPNP
ncbi:hypothetical protein THAOC_34493 [Thalassiosira oceanica]|uniref:Uncharacterized protein n=1 Tax=Thalassiosira oceanica TaxID=159749 RepID=K0R2F3_THAOC|nr:hypothetical protein THAOC_34493 [Thalassiosira oceanica]|eukprot:EJK46828.1 hypothetical protein THAOC_34493 [Thalassiosira oceanica]